MYSYPCIYPKCTKQKQSKCDNYCIAHYKLVNNLPPGKPGRSKTLKPTPDVALSSCLPVVSSSSNSSASSLQKKYSSGVRDEITKTRNGKRRASFTVDSADTSIVSKANSAGRSNKLDKKWICPKCHGDVRSRPRLQNCDHDDDDALAEPNNTTVTCAIKGCVAPRFHVSTQC